MTLYYKPLGPASSPAPLIVPTALHSLRAMTPAKDFIATSTITVDAPGMKVWSALVSPDAIKQYMFGATVISEWKEGSAIVWKGEWKGKPYEDKGVILRSTPGRVLCYTHFSPLAGLPDQPENYHTVTMELSPDGAHTRVTLSQNNNPTDETRQESEKNWGMMLAALKQYVEGRHA